MNTRHIEGNPGRGTRVVLVTPRPDPGKLSDGDGRRLAHTLDQLAALGWVAVAVVDPARHLDALRMITEGMADLVVVNRPEDFPLVRLAVDLPGRTGGNRTQRLPRPDMQRPAADVRQRRPQPVGPVDNETGADAARSPGGDQGRTRLLRGDGAALEIRRPVAEFGLRVAESARPETGECHTDLPAEIAQATARSAANAGAGFGTPMPNPGRRERSSERHARVAGRDRVRRLR